MKNCPFPDNKKIMEDKQSDRASLSQSHIFILLFLVENKSGKTIYFIYYFNYIFTFFKRRIKIICFINNIIKNNLFFIYYLIIIIIH